MDGTHGLDLTGAIEIVTCHAEGEVGDRRRNGERGDVRPTPGRRHAVGSANDHKSLQHIRHEVGMIPVNPAMVGRDEH